MDPQKKFDNNQAVTTFFGANNTPAASHTRLHSNPNQIPISVSSWALFLKSTAKSDGNNDASDPSSSNQAPNK